MFNFIPPENFVCISYYVEKDVIGAHSVSDGLHVKELAANDTHRTWKKHSNWLYHFSLIKKCADSNIFRVYAHMNFLVGVVW